MPPYLIRQASEQDIAAIAHHRAQMFVDMNSLPPTEYSAMVNATVGYLQRAMPMGEYVGWVACSAAQPTVVVGGAGAQHRRILPRPVPTAAGVQVMDGREAIVINVFTEPAWRRGGIARALMLALLDGMRDSPTQRVVLHASAEGRPLYEVLGFEATNEMRYTGPLNMAEPALRE